MSPRKGEAGRISTLDGVLSLRSPDPGLNSETRLEVNVLKSKKCCDWRNRRAPPIIPKVPAVERDKYPSASAVGSRFGFPREIPRNSRGRRNFCQSDVISATGN